VSELPQSQYGKVLEWVLSKGAYATPLAPAKLAADWQAHITAMQKNAKIL
jgi:hypothetical protein